MFNLAVHISASPTASRKLATHAPRPSTFTKPHQSAGLALWTNLGRPPFPTRPSRSLRERTTFPPEWKASSCFVQHHYFFLSQCTKIQLSMFFFQHRRSCFSLWRIHQLRSRQCEYFPFREPARMPAFILCFSGHRSRLQFWSCRIPSHNALLETRWLYLGKTWT